MAGKIDFDVGTILYIVITIVAVIAGVVRKKKKPAAKPSGSGAESKIEGFFKNLGVQLEGVVDETKSSVQTIADELIPGPDPALQTEKTAYTDFSVQSMDELEERDDRFMAYEGMHNPDSGGNSNLIAFEVVRSTDDSDIMNVTEDTSNPSYAEVVRDFDLQTAIIYSTIINRVEY